MDHAARAKKALERLIYSPRSCDGASDAAADVDAVVAGAAADAALFSPLHELQDAAEAAPKARPWERGDLWRRLRSFRPATWFCKPAAAGPVECARRGWVNAGQDLLACEFCKAKLAFSLPVSLSREETEKATAAFVEQLATKHAGDCPWRSVVCAPELAAFPPLPAETVHAEFAQRCASLGALDQLPPVAPAALAVLATSHGPQLDALLSEGPQQPQPRAPLAAPNAADQSMDPEPDAPAAPPPGARSRAAALDPAAVQQPDSAAGPSTAAAADSGPAANGVAQPAGAAASLLRGGTAAGSQGFGRRQRLLALLGWHAAPVPFGAVPVGSSSSAAASGGATPAAAQEQLPAGQAVIFCRMCGAKHGLWSFLGAGGPDLSSARRFRLPASGLANGSSGSRGRLRAKPAQADAATPASAPPTLQGNGSSGATPVAWRGFGSLQPAGGGGGGASGSATRRSVQLGMTTIAGGQMGGLTPSTGGTGGTGGSFGSGASGSFGRRKGSNAGAVVPPAPAAPFGAGSRGAPLFGTPASAGRPSLRPAPPPAAATIAGGALTPEKAADASVDPGTGALPQQPPQPQLSAAANGTFLSPAGRASAAGQASGASDPSTAAAAAAKAAAPAAEATQQPAASPFGGGAASAPIFGIAAMRSTSLGIPRAGQAATPKRPREEQADQSSNGAGLPKRPKTSRGLQETAREAPAAAPAAVAVDSPAAQPHNGAAAAAAVPPGPATTGGASQPVAGAAEAAAATAAAPAASTGVQVVEAPAAVPTPLDPLKLHRPFCPWVKWHEAGGARRCGWSWFLDALVPVAVDATAAKASADAEGQPRDRASIVMSLLKRVGVRR